MTLSKKISTHNFYAFLWHAGFLALAKNFIDVDTVIPAMLIESGGNAIHVGIMTAIMERVSPNCFSPLTSAILVSKKSFSFWELIPAFCRCLPWELFYTIPLCSNYIQHSGSFFFLSPCFRWAALLPISVMLMYSEKV